MTRKVYVFGLRGLPKVPGGVEKHSEQLYPRLAARGWDITVFTRKPYLLHWRELPEWRGVRLSHLWSPRIQGLEAAVHSFLAAIVCLARRPALVHIHNIGPGLWAGLLRLTGVCVVVTYHSINYHHKKWGRLAKTILKFGELICMHFADRVIVVSAPIANFLMHKYPRARLVVIPNGVELPEFRPPGDTLAGYGLQSGHYIFAASRFVPEKGLHDLVDAYAQIQGCGFKLVMAGDADIETTYSRELKRKALATPGIVLTGYVTGSVLAEFFSNAALFALPSHNEGHPVALLEAMSYGLSVVLSDIAPNREIPLPEGRYFPVGNVDVLAEKISYWMAKGPLSADERDRQIEMLRQRYNWDNIAEKVLGVYEGVICKQPSKSAAGGPAE